MARLSFATSVVALALAALPAMAAVPHHHDAATQPVPLQFDQGRKWSTDEALRLNMGALRDAFAARREAILQKSLSWEDSKALGVEIEQRVIAILTDCRLGPEADRNLHLIVAELVQASDVLQGKTRQPRERGVTQALRAVHMYAVYFDHPGWQAVL